MSGVFFCYVLAPIDDFGGLWKAEKVMSRGNKKSGELRRELCLAMQAALARGWHGDMAEGPYIFCFPDEKDGSVLQRAFIFKQEQGGWTYVVSRNEMPWLLEADCANGETRVNLDF